MLSQKRCCVPICTVSHGDGIALHRFPNPSLHDETERFRVWVMKIGGDLVGEDNLFIHRNRRVCHRHFEEKYTFPNNRLTKLAIPTLHIPGWRVVPQQGVPMIMEGPVVDTIDTSFTVANADIHLPEVSTSQAYCNEGPSLNTGVQVAPQQSVPMTLDTPADDILQTASIPTAVGRTPVASTSKASCNTGSTLNTGVQVAPQQSVPMTLDTPADDTIQTASIPTAVGRTPVASTSKASCNTVSTLNTGVQVAPQQSVPMTLDTPADDTLQTASIPTAVGRTPVASTSKASCNTGSTLKKASRARVSKSMSKVERELRNTLAETKVALRKCQNSKNKFRIRLNLAKKIMQTAAFENLTKKMSTAAKSFFKMQVSQFGKKAKGRRFTFEEKILALSIYKPCPKAYRLLGKICILPKRSTLDKVLKKVNLYPGINDILFENLKKTVQRMPNHHRLCTLVFDEMSIAPHVAYDIGNDIVTGFVDNGQERENKFCDHVLVFMVRGVIKKYKQPVAFTFCKGSTKTSELKKQIKEILKKINETGLKVIATVCDQGATNMAALNELMRCTKENYTRKKEVYKGGFFEVYGNKIYPIYDPPHIMKGIRNNLITKDLEYNMEGKVRRAKWAHLEALYRRGPGYKGVRLVNKLTAQHVVPNLIPKMRVKYCTQVFSQNVGVTMGYMAGLGKLPKESMDTADILLFFDELFDSVNGSFSKPVKGKIYRSAVTPRSPHMKLWYKALPILKSMTFVNKNGARSTVPSISSWVKTIEAFIELTKYLHSQGLNSLLLRHFNQDPLENFFGSIRAHGARNIMPSASAFINAYKTLLVNNLSSPHSVGFNCEEDKNTCLQSLKFFLTSNIETNKKSVTEIQEDHLQITEVDTNELITSESFHQKEKCAAIAYCSGWLVQVLKKNVYKKCKKCRSDMESENIEDFHKYIKIREYQKDKTWLSYPTREVFDYFCQIENIVIDVLKSSCHIDRISEYIELISSIHTNTNFLTCGDHREILSKYLLKKCLKFFINNWCKEVNNILNGKTDSYDEEDEMKRAAYQYYSIHKRRVHAK